MKRGELKKALRKMGVLPYEYNLNGKGRKDERLCMEFVNDEWHVYYIERGVKTTDESFASEEEACRFIYEEFLN